MGCSSSKNAQYRKEAEAYNQRKKNGFKDPGLEKHRKACEKQKKRLHHVDDPYKKKRNNEKKIHTIKKGQLKTTAKAGGGFNQNDILNAKANLKHRS